VAFSGHKMYAPFGAGALVGPRAAFAHGTPFLVGGNAVDFVTPDEVIFKPPPAREEAGSPNVLGAVALGAAARALPALGWDRVVAHDRALARALRDGLRAIDGVRVLGPGPGADTLPIAAFTVTGRSHALVAARLSAEFGIGVRHGCFCAHPYVERLLHAGPEDLRRFAAAARAGDRLALPGAVRASAGLATTTADVARLLDAVAEIAATEPPVDYVGDPAGGDCWPAGMPRPAAVAPAEGRPAALTPS
jgi:selenocysteine lyase/cysteine desulfurase